MSRQQSTTKRNQHNDKVKVLPKKKIPQAIAKGVIHIPLPPVADQVTVLSHTNKTKALPHSVARNAKDCPKEWNDVVVLGEDVQMRLEVIAHKDNGQRIVAYSVFYAVWRPRALLFFPQRVLAGPFYVGDGQDALTRCVDWMRAQGCEIE